MQTKLIKSIAGVALAMGFTAGSNATTISYGDFSSTAGLQLNGSTAQAGSVLRLTTENFNQSGSAFSSSAITLGANYSFSTFFRFRISSVPNTFGDGNGPGADGLVFVVQTNANNGGGLGGGIRTKS